MPPNILYGAETSVAHSASLGTGESLLKLAKVLDLPVSKGDPFYVYMKRVDKVSKFHGSRQTTPKFKSLRYIRSKQKSNRRLLQVSAYGANELINEEHGYGINPAD